MIHSINRIHSIIVQILDYFKPDSFSHNSNPRLSLNPSPAMINFTGTLIGVHLPISVHKDSFVVWFLHSHYPPEIVSQYLTPIVPSVVLESSNSASGNKLGASLCLSPHPPIFWFDQLLIPFDNIPACKLANHQHILKWIKKKSSLPSPGSNC